MRKGPPRLDPKEQILRHVEVQENGCWRWTGTTTSGYGKVTVDRVPVFAHRRAYELWVGPIPEGLVLDHVQARGCSTTLCVCPDHLEPVTPRENVLRGRAGYGLRSLCRKGLHDISASENVMVRADGSRTCLPCRRAVMLAANERYRERHPGATAEANRRYRARKKAACTSS